MHGHCYPSKHQRSPLHLKLDINSETVVQVTEHRVLSITIDDEFKWQSHVSNICKAVSNNLFLMSQLKRYVSFQTLKLFHSSHILPHINVSSADWDGRGETHLNKLSSLHRRVAKMLLPDKIHQQTKNWKPPACYRYKTSGFNKAVLMFKVTRESNNRTCRYYLHPA